MRAPVPLGRLAPGTMCGEPVGSAIHQRMWDCIHDGSVATADFTAGHSEIIV